MDEKTTVYIRGESGTIKPHDLPLPWPIEDKLAKGQVHEVNGPDDESDVTAPEHSPVVAAREQAERDRVLSSEPKPESPTEVPGRRDEEPGTDEHTPATVEDEVRNDADEDPDLSDEDEDEGARRPAVNAPKSEWVTYATQVDKDLTEGEANAMTKAELTEKY